MGDRYEHVPRYVSRYSGYFRRPQFSFAKVLRDLRRVCLTELRREVLIVGANALIGLDLDYNKISGDDKSMLFLVASDTAVGVRKT